MKKILFVLHFLLLLNQSFALSPLPRNSYLRLGDNQKEVKILQQILNSNPDTEVDDTGVGSPGKENWYFGQMTENALKRFQEKNNLEATGRIDFKTWKKLNDYVLGNTENTPISSTNTQSKIQEANEKRLSINEQNKKDFEEAKKLAAEKKLAETETKKEESKSYIQNLLDKYTGFFFTNKGDANNSSSSNSQATSTTNTTQTQDIYSNNYSAQTPYLNPSTGIYSSNPAAVQQPIQQPQIQPINNNLAGQPGLNPFLPQQENPYINYAQQLAPTLGAAGGNVGLGIHNGQVGSGFNRPGTVAEADGWIRGVKATNFGCNDTYARQYWTSRGSNNHNQTSMQSFSKQGTLPIDQDCRLFLVGIPQEIQRYFFPGQSPSSYAGTPIEVVNLRTNNCTVAPLFETGPGQCEGKNCGVGGSIDLTVAVKIVLETAKGDNFPVRYRPVPKGKRGCEDYNFFDPNGRGLNIPVRK